MTFPFSLPFGAPRSSSRPLAGREDRLRRDIGMDDWQGSIGTADPARLWPLPLPQDRRRGTPFHRLALLRWRVP